LTDGLLRQDTFAFHRSKAGRAPATGRQYTFSAAAQAQMVEAHDAAALFG